MVDGRYILGRIVEPSCAGISGIEFCNKTTVFIGDSITRGVAASPLLTNRWTTLFSTGKNTTESNLGVDGQTLQIGCFATFNQTTIPVYDSNVHGAMVFCLGTNDIGYNDGAHNPATYESMLNDTIDFAIGTRGWPPNKIVLMTPYYAIDYNIYVGTCSVTVPADQTLAHDYAEAVLSVASVFGCYPMNIRQAMIDDGLDSTYYDSDHLHPNTLGHAWIANYLINNL